MQLLGRMGIEARPGMWTAQLILQKCRECILVVKHAELEFPFFSGLPARAPPPDREEVSSLSGCLWGDSSDCIILALVQVALQSTYPGGAEWGRAAGTPGSDNRWEMNRLCISRSQRCNLEEPFPGRNNKYPNVLFEMFSFTFVPQIPHTPKLGGANMKPQQDFSPKWCTIVQISANLGIRKEKGHKSFLMLTFTSLAWSQIRPVVWQIQQVTD